MGDYDWGGFDRFSMYMEMGMFRPTSFAIVTPIETMTPEQIMAELRAKDPDSAAKLSELIVLDDNGNMTEESARVLRNILRPNE